MFKTQSFSFFEELPGDLEMFSSVTSGPRITQVKMRTVKSQLNKPQCVEKLRRPMKGCKKFVEGSMLSFIS